MVSDIVDDGSWTWPISWYTRAPVLSNCLVPNLTQNREDRVVWKDLHGNMKSFSVHAVWDVIRPRGNEVDWANIVWLVS